jgi:hypothetical protein
LGIVVNSSGLQQLNTGTGEESRTKTKMKTLTAAREFLEGAIADAKCDLRSDWIEQSERIELTIHLQLLINAKASLDAIAADGKDCQIFKSVIAF